MVKPSQDVIANRFRILARENFGEFTIANVNLEFGWVKHWRMAFGSPNSPKFPPRQKFVLYGS